MGAVMRFTDHSPVAHERIDLLHRERIARLDSGSACQTVQHLIDEHGRIADSRHCRQSVQHLPDDLGGRRIASQHRLAGHDHGRAAERLHTHSRTLECLGMFRHEF